METLRYATPQRKNLWLIEDVLVAHGFVSGKGEGFEHGVQFIMEDDTLAAQFYISIDRYDELYVSWTGGDIETATKFSQKFLEQRFPLDRFGEAENLFAKMQKQMKEAIRKENSEPKQEPQTEAEPKTEQPKQEIRIVKLQRPEAVGLESQINNIVYDALESEFSTQTLTNKMIELGIEPNRTEITIKKVDGTTTKVGRQHKQFESILQTISAKVNIALVGPAGSGKTTAVKEVAKALDLKFMSKSVSAQTGTHEFFGYQDANGNYVKTLFREAYEYGGVFLLDEFDAGNPNVLAALNQATANGECAFADGMVTRHEDFVIVMAGNTFGHGATSEYVGRNKIDAATLDRFAFIYFDYDEEFERDLATNKSWCKVVQNFRKKVAEKRIKTIISPRATFDGAKLLSVGMDIEQVKSLLIFKGLNKDEVKLLS